ncbi:MAG: serine/threonine-protein kinase [Pseudanabaenaceae cyanobacterium bins.68]|nr:serine/threonine-protein kinase [Pseudanabaenaceae cyanobacterium bins.68]
MVSVPPRYRIWGLVGRGQFGKVYVARDRWNHELVALKQLDQKLPTQRFLRELRYLVTLSHENIVAYLALEHYSQSRFLVMEYCEAGTLRDAIAHGNRLNYGQVHQIMTDVLAGLGYMHRAGIVHCDLKPENILLKLTAKGYVAKISDFGVARQLGQPNPADSQHSGSPAYMAPERFYGKFSIQSDIYALGVILYELLVGDRPFSGMPKDLMYAHLNQRLKIPAAVPEAIAAIINCALQKLPHKRFEHTAQMSQALDRALGEFDPATVGSLHAATTVPLAPEWLVAKVDLPVKWLASKDAALFYGQGEQVWQWSGRQPQRLADLPEEILGFIQVAEHSWYFGLGHIYRQIDLEPPQLFTQARAGYGWSMLAKSLAIYDQDQIQISQVITKHLITLTLPYRQVKGMVGLDRNHWAVVSQEPATGQFKLLVVARRGQVVCKLPLPEAIAQICASVIPNQVVLVSANPPYSLLIVDLQPYRLRRQLLDFKVEQLVSTSWGYLVTSADSGKQRVRLLDYYGQELGQIAVPSQVTALAPLGQQWVAIALEREIYVVDLKQIDIDLIL